MSILFVIYLLGRNPFSNAAGKVVMAKASTASFDEIVTNEYSAELVDVIHKMLNKVLIMLFF
jgi:hypothetical protein